MGKLELLSEYINECGNLNTSETEEYRKLGDEIFSCFGSEIKNMENTMFGGYYNPIIQKVICGTGELVDYKEDMQRIKMQLINYRANIENELAEKEIDKLRLQVEISKNQAINITNTATGGVANAQATSSSTVLVMMTIEQAIENMTNLPSHILDDEEKDLLEGKLSSLEVAKNSKNKANISDKLGSVLKYIGDKSVEVGIAVLPYLGEVSKFIESLQL